MLMNIGFGHVERKERESERDRGREGERGQNVGGWRRIMDSLLKKRTARGTWYVCVCVRGGGGQDRRKQELKRSNKP